jgi:hypothetical protein
MEVNIMITIEERLARAGWIVAEVTPNGTKICKPVEPKKVEPKK